MMASVIAAMTLAELVGPTAGRHASVAVNDLALDSRHVRPGAAFVAVPGTRAHGLDYARDAVERGAVIVLYDPADSPVARLAGPGLAVPGLSGRIGELADRFFWRQRPPPTLYGVTGTNGKTTVAYLVAQALTQLGHDCGYVGTLGYGRPDALQSHPMTTPDCFTLHRELVTIDSKVAMLEVSSHALVQDRIAGLPFAVTAVTNLSRDHLDAHGSMQAYARAKSRIVRVPGLQAVVLNLDDTFAAGLATEVDSAVRVLGVSTHAAQQANLTAAVTLRGFDGIELEVTFGSARSRLPSPLIGDFNADNLIVALGIVIATGEELADASAALARSRAAPGRMEAFGGPRAPRVVVDYAHTPAALERTLAVLRNFCAGTLTCVFGCGGDRDPGKRDAMGHAAGIADRIVLTDDNPRSEDPAAIVADIRRGIDADRAVRIEHDRARAITKAIDEACSGDVVLIAGKGHETTQLIGEERRALDDRQLVRQALRSRR